MPCSRTQHDLTRKGLEPPTSGSGVRGINIHNEEMVSDMANSSFQVIICDQYGDISSCGNSVQALDNAKMSSK